MNIRRKALICLFRLCGIPEGVVPPRWAQWLVYACFPSRIAIALSPVKYDWACDAIIIDGVHLSIRELSSMLVHPNPDVWFRVLEVTPHGPVIENKADKEYCPF